MTESQAYIHSTFSDQICDNDQTCHGSAQRLRETLLVLSFPQTIVLWSEVMLHVLCFTYSFTKPLLLIYSPSSFSSWYEFLLQLVDSVLQFALGGFMLGHQSGITHLQCVQHGRHPIHLLLDLFWVGALCCYLEATISYFNVYLLGVRSNIYCVHTLLG